MVAAPYVLLGAFVFLVYRGFKKLHRADMLREAELPPPESDFKEK
jgi:hypothetical protein